MTLLSPSRLWLLAVVAGVVVAYLLVQRRRREAAVRFTNLALLDVVAPRRPDWRRHVPAAAFLAALATMVVALARPARTVRVPRERATVVLAIDVSLSMEATDVEPSRIDATTRAAMRFVDEVPDTLNLGLVSFAGLAQVLVAPTTDHAQVKRSLAALELRPRTGVGEAVFASLAAIAAAAPSSDRRPVPARIVLMSDGATTDGRPDAWAAEAARAAGVPVSTIAFGTDHGVIHAEGQAVPVPVDRVALAQLAAATGGEAFAADTASELARVYSDIGSSVGWREGRREVTASFTGVALLLALAAAAGSLAWSPRLP